MVVIAALSPVVLFSAMPTAQAYLRPGTTQRASVDSDGDEFKYLPIYQGVASVNISANGRYVAFDSPAFDIGPDSLRPADLAESTASDWFAYVHDMRSGETEIVSVTSEGTLPARGCNGSAQGSARKPSLSDNGRFVAFISCFPDLVKGDGNDAWDVFVHDRKTGRTERVSVASDGTEADEGPSSSMISGNGRFVAFQSGADDLVADDTNDLADIFVHDRKTGKTERVSVSSKGEEADSGTRNAAPGWSACPSLSRDGRYVAFISGADNLVEGDTNAALDVFVRDRQTGKTERVSVSSSGTEGRVGQDSTVCWTGAYDGRRISGDGRFVTFWSDASSLVPNDSKMMDVFVHDRQTGRTERVSVNRYGEEGSEAVTFSRLSAIDGSGRYVAMESYSSFSEIDTGQIFQIIEGDNDVYLYDRLTGAMELSSVSTGGEQAKRCVVAGESPFNRLQRADPEGSYSTSASVSDGGRMIAFTSCADNLTESDTNLAFDAFVHDAGPALGVGGSGTSVPPPEICVSDICIPDEVCIYEVCLPPGALPVLTADDRNDRVTDLSQRPDLTGFTMAYRPLYADLFFREAFDRLPLLSRGGLPTTLHGVDLSIQGKHYQVRIQETPLVGASRSGNASFELFRCDPVCVGIGSLRGGYGTTGEEVVFSIPLAKIGLRDGGDIADARAFTGLGTIQLGPTDVLDSIDADRLELKV
ncbi:MAG: hypothetical protein ACRDLB_06035 [Actinomycetota bacterium]